MLKTAGWRKKPASQAQAAKSPAAGLFAVR
jgi:hypothetical protein